jgi:hypothetical protein
VKDLGTHNAFEKMLKKAASQLVCVCVFAYVRGVEGGFKPGHTCLCVCVCA